jgi:hypothetical protein
MINVWKRVFKAPFHVQFSLVEVSPYDRSLMVDVFRRIRLNAQANSNGHRKKRTPAPQSCDGVNISLGERTECLSSTTSRASSKISTVAIHTEHKTPDSTDRAGSGIPSPGKAGFLFQRCHRRFHPSHLHTHPSLRSPRASGTCAAPFRVCIRPSSRRRRPSSERLCKG